MTIWAYARVSTQDQSVDAQIKPLRDAGAERIVTETGSGADRDRPELARLLREIKRGDVLLVVKIDRVARSAMHLLTILEDLDKRGVTFRSLGDPIDLGSPTGRFMMQMVASFAEFELSLIRERTRAGVRAAIARGKRPGNPGVRAGDRAALRKIEAAKDSAFSASIAASAPQWLPAVLAMRPAHSWADVALALNSSGTLPPWTDDRLQRAARRAVREGLAPVEIMARTRPDGDRRLATFVAGVAAADSTATLKTIAERLEAMREPSPRGGRRWTEDAVAGLLAQAVGRREAA